MATKIILIMFALLLISIGLLEKANKKIRIRDRHIAAQQEALDRVPTFKELQIMVGAEPDGIIGPNTLEKWDEKLCQQEASKWDYYYEVKK